MKAFSLIILMACFYAGFAQFNPDQFLAAAVSDIELNELLVSEEYVKANRFNSPWLRELEVRARSNDSEIGLEDYRLRFGLINPAEISANRRYRDQLDNTIALRKTDKINDVLKQRYELLIEQLYLSCQRSNINTNLTILKQIKEIRLGYESVDLLEELLDSEQEILRQELELIDIEQKLQVNEFLIRERWAFEGELQIDTSDIITVDQLKIRLTNINAIDNNLDEKILQQEQLLEESLFEVEKAESWRNIGFIQTEYDIERGNEIEDHLGYQLGINIPIFKTDRPDLQRDQIDLLEKQARGKTKIEINNREQRVYEMNLQSLLVRYSQIDAQFAVLDQLEDLGSNDSRTSIGFMEKAARYRSFLNKRKYGLFTFLLTEYIRLLHKKGSLVATPMVNHLSRSLRQIDQTPLPDNNP